MERDIVDDIIVSASGPLISSLLYEHLKSNENKEGFLFGQVQNIVKEHISDTEINANLQRINLNLCTFYPCTMVGSFYNGYGDVNKEKLLAFLGEYSMKLIGWFRCAAHDADEIFFRDMAIHSQLSDIVRVDDDMFVMASLSSKYGDQRLVTRLKFQIEREGIMQPVALEVINMGDTSTSDYVLNPANPSLYESKTLQKMFDSIRNLEPGVLEMTSLHHQLMKKLSVALPRFAAAQEKKDEVEKRVRHLRQLCYDGEIVPNFTPRPIEFESKLNESMEAIDEAMEVDEMMYGTNDEIKMCVKQEVKKEADNMEIASSHNLKGKPPISMKSRMIEVPQFKKEIKEIMQEDIGEMEVKVRLERVDMNNSVHSGMSCSSSGNRHLKSPLVGSKRVSVVPKSNLEASSHIFVESDEETEKPICNTRVSRTRTGSQCKNLPVRGSPTVESPDTKISPRNMRSRNAFSQK